MTHDPSDILISHSIINIHKKYSLQNTIYPNINTKKTSNLKSENQARLWNGTLSPAALSPVASLSKDANTPNYGLPLLCHISEPSVDETHQIKPPRQNNQATETHQIRPTSPPCLMTSPTKSNPRIIKAQPWNHQEQSQGMGEKERTENREQRTEKW